jgi:dCMP deaminase
MRPSRTRALIETAFIWAERSTCARLHVGAVFARDGRILVQGYNGAPAGLPHCNHDCQCGIDVENEQGRQSRSHQKGCPTSTPCTVAVHAEQGAIAWAARSGVSLEGSDLYCTHQPCLPCAQSIINAGIKTVRYVEEYRLKDGIDLLTLAGVQVLPMTRPRDRVSE